MKKSYSQLNSRRDSGKPPKSKTLKKIEVPNRGLAKTTALLMAKTTDTSVSAVEWMNALRAMSKSAKIIQRVFRGYVVRKMCRKKRLSIRYTMMVYMKLKSILRCRVRPRIRARHGRFMNYQCTVIQRYMRGCITRNLLFRRMLARVVIFELWRKYKLTRQLRCSLRRLDRPLVIMLHGLRDFPVCKLQANRIQVRVKIWWHKLLHLSNSKDMYAVLDAKKPHFIYTISKSFKATVKVNNRGNSPVKAPSKAPSFAIDNSDISSELGILKSLSIFGSLKLPGSSASEGLVESPADSKTLCDIDFEDEVLRIGSCHGDSVIKFEILDGEIKHVVGTHTFHMSKKNKLMFWGGEYQEPLALPPARVRQGGLLTPLSLAGQLQKPAALLNLKRSGRATQLTTAGENATADKDPTAFPVLEFRVKQDVRAQWGVINVCGTDPLQLKGKTPFNFMFTKWTRVMISLSHEQLNFYEKTSSTVPLVSVSIPSISDIKVTKGDVVLLSAINSGASTPNKRADTHDICITTDVGGRILIRMCDLKSRREWVYWIHRVCSLKSRASAHFAFLSQQQTMRTPMHRLLTLSYMSSLSKQLMNTLRKRYKRWSQGRKIDDSSSDESSSDESSDEISDEGRPVVLSHKLMHKRGSDSKSPDSSKQLKSDIHATFGRRIERINSIAISYKGGEERDKFVARRMSQLRGTSSTSGFLTNTDSFLSNSKSRTPEPGQIFLTKEVLVDLGTKESLDSRHSPFSPNVQHISTHLTESIKTASRDSSVGDSCGDSGSCSGKTSERSEVKYRTPIRIKPVPQSQYTPNKVAIG